MIKVKILSKLDLLENYIGKFFEILPEKKQDYLDSFEKQLAVERLLQLSIELMIDISALLVKYHKLGLPASEEEIFTKLASKLPHYELYQEMKRFRNVLVHKYGEINSDLVYHNATERISDFELFLKEVKMLLD